MKNYLLNNKAIAILAVIVLSASCSKQIDLRPTDEVGPDKAFETVADLEAGLLGAYQGMTYYSNIFYTSRVTDETMLPSENSTGSGFATYRWQYDGSSPHDAWLENYVIIDRVNRVLAVIDEIEEGVGEQGTKDKIKGELLALRAYAHLELIRNFADKYEPSALGVPYMEKSEISSPSRLTFAETMAKINADLAAAKPLIPESADDNTRITRAAVSAIQARVALYEQNWDNALAYSTEAINALPLATRTDFPDIWKDESEDEVIWKAKRVVGDEEVGGIYTQAGYLDDPAGTRVYFAASYELTELFDQDNDIRFQSYITIDEDREAEGETPNVVVKYMSNDPGSRNLADLKLFRTGEMYLIRAEAYARKNDLGNAADDLNDLRAERIDSYADESFSGQQEILDAILTERFKELAFEGHRHFDLRRYNLPITRNPEDAINALGAVLLEPTDAQYVFAIPNSELRANPNMVQNSNY